MKKLILTLAMSLIWPLMASADFDAGLQAYKSGDYAAALQQWRPLAEAGNPNAQNNLGAMYYGGQGVPKDEARAYAWASLAVAQGETNARAVIDYLHKNLTPAQLSEGQKLRGELCAKIPNCK